jgi:hypothetical protein
MTATLPSTVRDLPLGLARRALDIACDPGLSRADGARHLLRLAKERELPLRLALAHLRRGGSTSAVCEHACMLLGFGIAELQARSEPATPALSA